MLSISEIKEMMTDLESDRIERTTSFREDKLGPASCAFSNDFPNHKKPGYILLGVNDNGTVKGMTMSKANAKTYDLVPCIGAKIADLSLEYFKLTYLPLAIDKVTLETNNRDVKDQLASLRFYDIWHNCPTNAGILVLGINPLFFFPSAYIQYVKLNGTGVTAAVDFEKKFSGAIITELKNIDDFIKSNIIKEKPVRKDSFQEDKVVNYPFWAMRELVMNAVMHRNFDSNAPVYIYEFTDRIEIINPGGLYGDVNASNFPNASDYRNIVIAEAMRNLGFVNRFNFGVKRAIEDLIQNGNGEPIFDLSLVTKFKVTIPINAKW